MKFINVPQSKTCRYSLDVTSSEIAGFFTDTFTTCIILVLFKDNKISLTHVDDGLLQWPLKSHPLKDELNWVGKDCYKLIVMKENPVSHNSYINLINKIRNFYSKSVFSSIILNKAEILAVSIDRNVFSIDPNIYIDWNYRTKQRHELPPGISLYHRGEAIPSTIRHQDEWRLLSTHILRYAGINHKVSYEVEQTHVLFNGQDWAMVKDEEKILDSEMYNFYLGNMPSSPSVFQVFDNLLSKVAGFNENTMLVSFYLQQFIHKNDYIKIKELKQKCPEHCKQLYDTCMALYKFDELFERQAKESVNQILAEKDAKANSSNLLRDIVSTDTNKSTSSYTSTPKVLLSSIICSPIKKERYFLS